MRSYYKYTNGSDFTIGDIPYTGFFNISNGEVYTGKINTDTSEHLTPNNTFMTDFFVSGLEYGDGGDTEIDDIYSNVFDLFNRQELSRVFDTLNRNNLKIFRKLISPNPNIIDVGDTIFYGLSSSEIDTSPNDVLNGKNRRIQTDPFSYSVEWSFLDDVKYGVMLGQANDQFIYIVSNGQNLVILRGEFNDKTTLKVERQEDYGETLIYGIHYNDIDKELLIQYKNNVIVYNSDLWKLCDNDVVTNDIRLDGVFSSNNKVKFGRDYKITEFNGSFIIEDKHSDESIREINLKDYGIYDVLDIDIRNTDDLVCILHDSNQLTIFDILSFDKRITTSLENFSKVDRFIPELISETFINNKRVKFSNFDSGVIFTSNFDSVEMRFILDPTYPTSKTNRTSFNYIKDYKFGDFDQKFGSSILKWNSNTMKSNFFNNLIFFNGVDDFNNYYMFHNIGRLYPIKMNLNSAYTYAITQDLVKKYIGVECSDSSIGMFFNANISNLLSDILTIYNQAKYTFNIDDKGVTLREIREIDVEIKNLFLNINETINVISIQRILSKIISLQRSIISPN